MMKVCILYTYALFFMYGHIVICNLHASKFYQDLIYYPRLIIQIHIMFIAYIYRYILYDAGYDAIPEEETFRLIFLLQWSWTPISFVSYSVCSVILKFGNTNRWQTMSSINSHT